MRVAEAMTRDVQVIKPDQSIVDAAKMMADCDVGALPVADNDKLVGMITDRDIIVRGLAQGKSQDCRVQDVMSADIKYCFDDEDIDDVAQNMGELQIRRLPVVSRDKRLVGIVSLGDIAVSEEAPAGQALSHISESSSEHRTH